jgi:hypothetical protein
LPVDFDTALNNELLALTAAGDAGGCENLLKTFTRARRFIIG